MTGFGLSIRGRDGDWGLNGDGALYVSGRIDSERNAMKVWNATQWFQKTGEIWAVNTTSFAEHEGRVWFSTQVPFRPLDIFLGNAVAAIREMGGTGPIGIKLGTSNISDTVLPGRPGSTFIEAVGTDATAEDRSDVWTLPERRELLLKFWNALMDAYGERPMTMQELSRRPLYRLSEPNLQTQKFACRWSLPVCLAL